MSFVGTRPEAVKYVKEYKPEYMAMPVSIPFRWRMLWSCSRERHFLL